MKKEEEKIIRREQVTLSDLLETIKNVQENKEDAELLVRTAKQLEELFLIVVVGEFNAGKSSFINSLLGDSFLKSGITPTTTNLHVIRYGNRVRNEYNEETRQLTLELPLAWLRVSLSSKKNFTFYRD